MIEIQCTSCHTRYRIDERVLPEDTPTFKCSRCGHVFSAEPRTGSRPAARKENADAAEPATSPAPRQSSRKVPALKSAAPVNTRPSAPSVDPILPAEPAAAAPPQPSEPAPAEPQTVARVRSDNPPGAHDSAGPQTPPSNPSSADLSRPFDAFVAEEPRRHGENLAFDFNDAPSLEDQPEPDVKRHQNEWRVGDDAAEIASQRRPTSSQMLPEMEPPASPAEARPANDEASFFDERATVPERPPYVPDHAQVHSTGFILGLFVLVALAFGASSLMICNAPVASAEFLNELPGIQGRFAPPIVPARLVAIKDVRSDYRTIKGSQALVVTGNVINVGSAPLHTVQLAATLLDATRRPLAGTTIFCGNHLASTMIGEMTPRELEFFQRLEPPKHFVLKPLAPTPFTMVFIGPPTAVSSLSIAVAKAVPASPAELAQGAPAE
jgi:predicted Zn finger-like uncharacterized protein